MKVRLAFEGKRLSSDLSHKFCKNLNNLYGIFVANPHFEDEIVDQVRNNLQMLVHCGPAALERAELVQNQ